MHRMGMLLLLSMVGFGCGGMRGPVLTEATVTVLLDGQPLPFAQVTFTPASTAHSSDAVATGVTDEKGVARLMCGIKSGACVGLNRVTVTEGPVSEDGRGDDAQAQMKATAQLSKLKNRPIPPRYAILADGGIEVEVKAGQAEYKVELTK